MSGKNKLPMADLRRILNDLGFQKVQTYIQSGNVILVSNDAKNIICKKINEAVIENFGYDIPVIIRTISEWEKAIENYPFSTENEKIVGFSFLDRVSEIKEITIDNIKDDQFKIDEDMVYFYCPNGFGKSKITNNIFEKKLKVTATTRNLRTTLKLLALAKNIRCQKYSNINR